MHHQQLKRELSEHGYTCVAFDENGQYFSSFSRGIVPLFELCKKNTTRQPLYVADKVIGKAAALLCAKSGVTMLYADIVTQSALNILQKYDIDTQYGKAVSYIVNRTGDDKCPMEKLAAGVTDPEVMFDRVKEFLNRIENGEKQ